MKRSAVLVLVACLSGCHRDIQNKEAVRQGVVEYLSQRSDLMALDVQVTGVKFQSNQADALVYLSAKGTSPPGNGMEMRYLLQRKGNRWVVQSRGNSGNAHGAGMTPQLGDPHATSLPALPPGHPKIPAAEPPGSAK